MCKNCEKLRIKLEDAELRAQYWKNQAMLVESQLEQNEAGMDAFNTALLTNGLHDSRIPPQYKNRRNL